MIRPLLYRTLLYTPPFMIHDQGPQKHKREHWFTHRHFVIVVVASLEDTPLIASASPRSLQSTFDPSRPDHRKNPPLAPLMATPHMPPIKKEKVFIQ